MDPIAKIFVLKDTKNVHNGNVRLGQILVKENYAKTRNSFKKLASLIDSPAKIQNGVKLDLNLQFDAATIFTKFVSKHCSRSI